VLGARLYRRSRNIEIFGREYVDESSEKEWRSDENQADGNDGSPVLNMYCHL